MSQKLTLTLSDDVDEAIQRLAEPEDAGTLVATWINEALTRRRLRRLNGFGDGDSLSAQEHETLAQLLDQDLESLDDSAQIQLSELLHQYRQALVRQAQAITDWLAAETPTAYEVAVTELTIVESSMLYAMGYDAERRVLEVVFNSGGIYRYFEIPPELYRELAAAASKGRFMWEHIFNLFPYERLRVRRKKTAS